MKLFLRNEVQVALWDEELVGQISDGLWENAKPHNHWRAWSECDAEVSPDNVGINFQVKRKDYDFTELIEYVGDRMLEIVRRFRPAATIEDVRHELLDINNIIKHVVISRPS